MKTLTVYVQLGAKRTRIVGLHALAKCEYH